MNIHELAMMVNLGGEQVSEGGLCEVDATFPENEGINPKVPSHEKIIPIVFNNA